MVFSGSFLDPSLFGLVCSFGWMFSLDVFSGLVSFAACKAIHPSFFKELLLACDLSAWGKIVEPKSFFQGRRPHFHPFTDFDRFFIVESVNPLERKHSIRKKHTLSRKKTDIPLLFFHQRKTSTVPKPSFRHLFFLPL